MGYDWNFDTVRSVVEDDPKSILERMDEKMHEIQDAGWEIFQLIHQTYDWVIISRRKLK